LDSLDEQIFAFTPIVFQDVIPIVEGKQQKFFGYEIQKPLFV